MVRIKNIWTSWIYWLFSIIIFLLLIFFVSKSLYEEKLLDIFLKSFKSKNIEIELKNDLSKLDLEYYQTFEFKDLYAKEKLNLLQQWEKVFIIKNNIKNINFLENEILKDKKENIKNLKVIFQWKEYFNI